MHARNIIDDRCRLSRPPECEYIDTFAGMRETSHGLVAVFRLSDRTRNRIISEFATRSFTRSKRQLESDLSNPAMPEGKTGYKTRQRDEWQKALNALCHA